MTKMIEKSWSEVVKAFLARHGVELFLLGVTFTTAFLLFASANILYFLFEEYKFVGLQRLLISFLFVCSIGMLLPIPISKTVKLFVQGVPYCKRQISKWRLKSHIKRLSVPEKMILMLYLNNGTEQQYLPLDPPVIRLQQKKIIYRPRGFYNYPDKFLFCLADGVREILSKSVKLDESYEY